MTVLYETEATLKHASKKRPKSLIFRVTGVTRELMNFKHNDKVKVQVCYDESNKKKYIKLYEMD